MLYARSVDEGIDHLLGTAVDLVLLDCVLPGGTMWQIVFEADRQEVPVVLMAGDPAQRRDIAGGDRPYLLKPFTVSALLAAVEANALPADR